MRRPSRPAVLRGCVFRARDVLADGVLTPAALRSSAWRRIYRGVYVDSSLPDGFDLRVRGAALLSPPVAAFTGRTAAWLHGAAELADLRDPVEVTVPVGYSFGPVTGLRVRHVDLHPADVTTVARRRCTTPVATALALAAVEPPVRSVAALDLLLRRGIVGKGELADAGATLSGRGAKRARTAIGLADPRAESQPESSLRVVLALAGIVTVPQHTVRDGDGGFVARVDLALPDLRIAIEYDGGWHAEAQQLSKDRRRMNRLAAAGWRIFFVTAADLRDPAALVTRLRAFLSAATSGNQSF